MSLRVPAAPGAGRLACLSAGLSLGLQPFRSVEGSIAHGPCVHFRTGRPVLPSFRPPAAGSARGRRTAPPPRPAGPDPPAPFFLHAQGQPPAPLADRLQADIVCPDTAARSEASAVLPDGLKRIYSVPRSLDTHGFRIMARACGMTAGPFPDDEGVRRASGVPSGPAGRPPPERRPAPPVPERESSSFLSRPGTMRNQPAGRAQESGA